MTLAFDKRAAGDKTVYEWRYANPTAITDLKLGLDAGDLWPRLYASSYRSYEDLARAYAAESDPMISVTPVLQAQADEITAGTTDHRRQAELIYDWVSRHIRYVAVEIAASAYIPHAAETVLANGYGDCKDHSALVVALLKAKHIKAELVLINLGASFALGSPPAFGSLNHEIAYLPDFNLYIDTTAGVAPFGVLPFAEYGKPVVHIGQGPALRRTPLLPAGAASISLRTTARLDADGRVTGDSEAASKRPLRRRHAAVRHRHPAGRPGTGREDDAAIRRQGGHGQFHLRLAVRTLEGLSHRRAFRDQPPIPNICRARAFRYRASSRPAGIRASSCSVRSISSTCRACSRPPATAATRSRTARWSCRRASMYANCRKASRSLTNS